MGKKNNQAKPEGCSQPEIEINSRWKDSWGLKMTVTKVQDNRITYIRDGYQHDCICSSYRLRTEFTFLPGESAARQAEAKENGLKKVQEIRRELAQKTTLPLSVGSDGYDWELK